MKIRLDAQISYRVANALKAFVSNRSGGLVIDWVGDDNPPGTTDPTWIRKYSESGGIAIISGDGKILQNRADLVAYIESGLIGFWVPHRFDDFKGYAQAAILLRWFPAIVEKVKASERGDCWQFPMSWTPDIKTFKQLRDPREHPSAATARPLATIHQFRQR